MTCNLAYEELAAWLAEDCTPERAAQIASHVSECEVCRTRIGALHRADRTLSALAAPEPPAACSRRVLETSLAEARAVRPQEVMTFDEVAAFLRIPPDDLEGIAEELPAFEIAGHVRVRRTRLLEWIEQRERQHRKNITESELAQALSTTVRQGFLGRG